MASSTPDERTGTEKAGSQDYSNRHFEKIFKEGFSFSGYERDKVFLGGPDGKFVDISPVSGADSITDGRGTVFADFDNDGDTDLFLTTIQGPVHLMFRNNIGQDARWIRFVLEGTRSNRDAVGAIVKVSAGDGTEAKVVSAGAGYLSGHDQRLLFGLGMAAQTDSVEVRWPSGLVQRFGALRAGQTLRLTEGEETPAPVRVARFSLPDPITTPEPPTLVAEGDDFPTMKLATPSGAKRALSSLRKEGGWMLVNFWATWCVPCNKEMPHLQKISRSYADSLTVVGISLDLETPDAVGPFLKKKGITYPTLLAETDTPLLVFHEDDVLLPSSFLVGPDGVVRAVFTGGSDATLARMDRMLADLLRPSGGN